MSKQHPFLLASLVTSLLAPIHLQAQVTDPLGDAARTQRDQQRNTENDAKRRAQKEQVKRQLDARTDALTQSLYQAARQAGIQMAEVKPLVEILNRVRRNAGMGDLSVGRELDGPYLVMMGDYVSSSPTFAIQGATMFGLSGNVRDKQFESTGTFSPTCQYEVSLHPESRMYPCQAYLDGKIDHIVLSDMKVFLAKVLRERR